MPHLVLKVLDAADKVLVEALRGAAVDLCGRRGADGRECGQSERTTRHRGHVAGRRSKGTLGIPSRPLGCTIPARPLRAHLHCYVLLFQYCRHAAKRTRFSIRSINLDMHPLAAWHQLVLPPPSTPPPYLSAPHLSIPCPLPSAPCTLPSRPIPAPTRCVAPAGPSALGHCGAQRSVHTLTPCSVKAVKAVKASHALKQPCSRQGARNNAWRLGQCLATHTPNRT